VSTIRGPGHELTELRRDTPQVVAVGIDQPNVVMCRVRTVGAPALSVWRCHTTVIAVGREGNRRTVWRPGRPGIVTRRVGELVDGAGGEIREEHLVVAADRAGENDAPAVGRERGIFDPGVDV
jgi:hypothetical protein